MGYIVGIIRERKLVREWAREGSGPNWHRNKKSEERKNGLLNGDSGGGKALESKQLTNSRRKKVSLFDFRLPLKNKLAFSIFYFLFREKRGGGLGASFVCPHFRSPSLSLFILAGAEGRGGD